MKLALLLIAGLLSTGGCTAFDVLNAMVPPCGYDRTKDIAYGTIPRQKLDVYRANDMKPNARVVIFFYGGEWQAGEKGNYRFAAQALASEGFLVVLPDYRLYPQAAFPAFVEDGAKAIRWARDNVSRFGGDPNHLYLMGHSAGAHIAALLTFDERYLEAVGLHRSDIRASVLMSGPYDFLPYREDWPVFNMKPGDREPPGDIEPINFVDGHEPPVLLIHGLLDDVVSPDEAARLQTRIAQKGGQVRYFQYPSRAHQGIVLALAWPFRWLAPVLHDAADYMRSQ